MKDHAGNEINYRSLVKISANALSKIEGVSVQSEGGYVVDYAQSDTREQLVSVKLAGTDIVVDFHPKSLTVVGYTYLKPFIAKADDYHEFDAMKSAYQQAGFVTAFIDVGFIESKYQAVFFLDGFKADAAGLILSLQEKLGN